MPNLHQLVRQGRDDYETLSRNYQGFQQDKKNYEDMNLKPKDRIKDALSEISGLNQDYFDPDEWDRDALEFAVKSASQRITRRIQPSVRQTASQLREGISEIPLEVIKDNWKVEASHIAYKKGMQAAQEHLNSRFPQFQIEQQLSNEHGLVIRDTVNQETHLAFRGTEPGYNPSSKYTGGRFGKLGGLVPGLTDIAQDARILLGFGQTGGLMSDALHTAQLATDKFGSIHSVSGYSLGGAKAAHVANHFNIPRIRYFNPFFGAAPTASSTHLGLAPTSNYNINQTIHDVWRTTTDLPSTSHPIITRRVANSMVNSIEPQALTTGNTFGAGLPTQTGYFPEAGRSGTFQRFNPTDVRQTGLYGHDPLGLGDSHSRRHFADDPRYRGYNMRDAFEAHPYVPHSVPEFRTRLAAIEAIEAGETYTEFIERHNLEGGQHGGTDTIIEDGRPKLTGGRVGKGGGYWTIWEDEHRAIGKPLNYTAEEIDFLNRNPNTENYQMKIAPPESAEFRALDAEGRQAHLRSIFTDPADMPTGGLEAHQNQIDMQRAALIGAEESIENIGRWATIAKAFKSGGLNVVNLGVGGLGGLAGVGLINAIDPTNSIPTELRQTLTGAAGGVGSEVFLSRLRGIKLATNLRNLGAASGVGAVAMGGGLAVEEAVHALLDFIPGADEGAKFVASQTAGGAASGALFGSQVVQQASMKAAQLLGQVASPAIRVAAQAVAPLAEGIGSAAGTVGSAITEGVAGASSAISSALGTTATAAGEAIVGTELTAVGAGIAETAGLSSAVGVAGETALGATGIIDALGAVETTAATIGEFAGMAEAGALTAEAGLVGAGEIGAIAGAELAGAELAGVAGAVGGELAAGEIGALAAGEVAAMALGETAAIEAGVVAGEVGLSAAGAFATAETAGLAAAPETFGTSIIAATVIGGLTALGIGLASWFGGHSEPERGPSQFVLAPHYLTGTPNARYDHIVGTDPRIRALYAWYNRDTDPSNPDIARQLERATEQIIDTLAEEGKVPQYYADNYNASLIEIPGDQPLDDYVIRARDETPREREARTQPLVAARRNFEEGPMWNRLIDDRMSPDFANEMENPNPNERYHRYLLNQAIIRMFDDMSDPNFDYYVPDETDASTMGSGYSWLYEVLRGERAIPQYDIDTGELDFTTHSISQARNQRQVAPNETRESYDAQMVQEHRDRIETGQESGQDPSVIQAIEADPAYQELIHEEVADVEYQRQLINNRIAHIIQEGAIDEEEGQVSAHERYFSEIASYGTGYLPQMNPTTGQWEQVRWEERHDHFGEPLVRRVPHNNAETAHHKQHRIEQEDKEKKMKEKHQIRDQQSKHRQRQPTHIQPTSYETAKRADNARRDINAHYYDRMRQQANLDRLNKRINPN